MCNEWCFDFVKAAGRELAPDARILEVGSLNVNGSVRDGIGACGEYIGVDLRRGPGVDRVLAVEELSGAFGAEFDAVIGSSLLEHVADWRAALRQMAGTLRVGGRLIVTLPAPGFPYHPYPLDNYRFSVDDVRAIFGGPLELVHLATDEQPGAEMVGAVARRLGEDLTAWGQELDGIEVHPVFGVRVNFGSGDRPLKGWTNVDREPTMPAEVHADVLPYLAGLGDESVDEIYAGHFLEHLSRMEADLFLDECFRVLTPGGRLGVVVPDTWEVMSRYVEHRVDAVQIPVGVWRTVADLDDVCAAFLYCPPTVQGSPHKWSWDRWTLIRALGLAGFENLMEIDRHRDARLGAPAWYQVGFDGFKPGGDHRGGAETAEDRRGEKDRRAD